MEVLGESQQSETEVRSSSDLRSILEKDLAEESFVAGLVGNAASVNLNSPPSALDTSSEKAWDEAERLRGQRRELGAVIERRLGKCVQECSSALSEARGAPELRTALRSALAACQSALAADEERRGADEALDAALESLGRPVVVSQEEDTWTASSQVEAAVARARAEGRAEALSAMSEKERLREKCALYKDRVASLEKELRASLKDVPLDEESPEELRERLDRAERRLAALAGTERHKRLRALETELEEQSHIIAALRNALDVGNQDAPKNGHSTNGHAPVLSLETPETPAKPPPTSPLMTSVSCVSDPSAFDDSDEDKSPPEDDAAFFDDNEPPPQEERDVVPVESAVVALEMPRGVPFVDDLHKAADVIALSSGTYVV